MISELVGKVSKKPYPNRVGVFVCARLHEDLVDVVDMGPQDGHEGLDLRRREVAVGRQVGVESHCLYTLFYTRTSFTRRLGLISPKIKKILRRSRGWILENFEKIEAEMCIYYIDLRRSGSIF